MSKTQAKVAKTVSKVTKPAKVVVGQAPSLASRAIASIKNTASDVADTAKSLVSKTATTTKQTATKVAKTTAKAKKSWTMSALDYMSENLAADHKRITSEGVRSWLTSRKFKKPTHSAFYGSLISRAVNMGLLSATNKLETALTPSSKGRKVRVYSIRKMKAKRV